MRVVVHPSVFDLLSVVNYPLNRVVLMFGMFGMNDANWFEYTVCHMCCLLSDFGPIKKIERVMNVCPAMTWNRHCSKGKPSGTVIFWTA